MLSAKACSLCDQVRTTRCERPQDCCQRCLAACILGIDHRQSAESELCAGSDIVELADIAEEIE
jgi:hypothetical protein